MDRQEIRDSIHQFFIEDGKVADGYIRKSVLLQMIRDLQFNLGIGRDGWMSLRLDKEQEKIKKEMLPLLTPVLLFSSAVDLLARVKLGRVTRQGENGDVFKGLLENYFDFHPTESDIFWRFRCSLSHQYVMPKNVALYRAGSQDIIMKVINVDDLWLIYVHPMYTSLNRAKAKIYEEIIALDESQQTLVAEFIKDYGFIRQQLGKESKSAD